MYSGIWLASQNMAPRHTSSLQRRHMQECCLGHGKEPTRLKAAKTSLGTMPRGPEIVSRRPLRYLPTDIMRIGANSKAREDDPVFCSEGETATSIGTMFDCCPSGGSCRFGIGCNTQYLMITMLETPAPGKTSSLDWFVTPSVYLEVDPSIDDLQLQPRSDVWKQLCVQIHLPRLRSDQQPIGLGGM